MTIKDQIYAAHPHISKEDIDSIIYSANATVKHHLAGRLMNLRLGIDTVNTPLIPDEVKATKKEGGALTVGKYLDILQRDINFISEYVKDLNA